MRLSFTFVICAALAAPVLAAPVYRAINWLYVVPVSADTFEVIDDRGESARAIWCAAADYVRAAGLDGVQKRIYIVEPRGPSQTQPNVKAVMFTTNPDAEMANTPSSYSVSVNRRGENLGVGHAYNFCVSLLEERFDRF